MYYTISDYENICVDNFELNQSVLDSIVSLENVLNLNSEKKEHFFEKKPKHWNHVKTFQKTSFIQNVSEEDKIYNEIRNSLNKLSVNNYDSQSNNILANVEKCEDKEKIINTIYNVACSNKVFSELYAKLFKELCTKYECFSQHIPMMVSNYKEKVGNIEYKDPNIDYDEYCGYTKNNDILRSSLMFFVNLFKHGLLKRDDLVELIMFLLDVMDTNKVLENRRNEMEEFVEQLFILCKNVNICLCENFDEIKSRIENVSNSKNTGNVVSMSSRVNFRCMDILDTLK
jgi:hypothetical protein